MGSGLVAVVASIAATYVFLRAFVYLTQDPREPPAVVGTVPFLSPVIGMAREKSNYYVRMRNKHRHPIYTLRSLGPRLYIANSLQLIQRIDRHIDTVAFTPIEMRAADKAMGLSKSALEKIGGDHLFSENGYLMGFPRAVAAATMPGRGLDALQRESAKTLTALLNDLAATGPKVIDLHEFVRHAIFKATTEATYGPHNPWSKPENEKTWYTFESGIMAMLIGFLPNIVARKSLQAREDVAAVFQEYLRGNKHLEGSLFLKLRHEHNTKFGLTLDDTARTEIGQVLAAISNTVASAFWAIWQILADPVVFQDCQREALALVNTDADGNHTIDLARVRTACPILVATWREVIRFHGISIQARVVQKDIVVDDRYLLKKDSLLMMPNGVLHSDEATWGPTAGKFNHKRFVTPEKGQVRDKHRLPPPSAFRGFGGGHVICPGRHFASGEILSLIVLLLVRFDARPVTGAWTEPGKDFVMNASFPNPLNKVEVEMTPKDDGAWRVLFSDSDAFVEMAAEEEEKE